MSTHLGLPANRVPQMLMACWWLSSFSPLEFAQIISQTHLNNIKVSCKHHLIFKAYESPATSTYHLICPKIIRVFGPCPNPSGLAGQTLLVGQVGSFGRSAAEVQRPGGGCSAGRACRGRARGGSGGGGAGGCGGADHGDGGRTCQLRLGCGAMWIKSESELLGVCLVAGVGCSIAQVPVVFDIPLGLIVWVPHASMESRQKILLGWLWKKFLGYGEILWD